MLNEATETQEMGIAAEQINNLSSPCIKISEVIHRLFHEDFSTIVGTQSNLSHG